MNKDVLYAMLVVIICLLLGGVGGYVYRGDRLTVETKIDTLTIPVDSIHLDTVYSTKTERRDPAKEDVHDTTTITRIDSFYCAKPYSQQFDTITAKKDTVGFRYLYPERFIVDLSVRPHPQITTVEKTIYTDKKDPWYIDLGKYLLGGVVGYAAGRIK